MSGAGTKSLNIFFNLKKITYLAKNYEKEGNHPNPLR